MARSARAETKSFADPTTWTIDSSQTTSNWKCCKSAGIPLRRRIPICSSCCPTIRYGEFDRPSSFRAIKSEIISPLVSPSPRVYDEDVLSHVWRIGPMPCAVPPTRSHVPFLNSLGDTAVDFDIAPPRVVPSSGNDTLNLNHSTKESTITAMSRVQWPLIILRGDGTLYVLSIGIETAR